MNPDETLCEIALFGHLASLTASGMLLEPDVTRQLTQVKLGLVLLVTWNGLVATLLHRRLAETGTRSSGPGHLLLAGAFLSAGVSHAGWWGAMVIGLVNH